MVLIMAHYIFPAPPHVTESEKQDAAKIKGKYGKVTKLMPAENNQSMYRSCVKKNNSETRLDQKRETNACTNTISFKGQFFT